VLTTPSKLLLAIALTGFIGPTVRVAYAQSAPAPDAKQPQWKDRTEYDLFMAASSGKDPAANIAKLDEWKKQYKDTQFLSQRDSLYLSNYAAQGKIPETISTAKDILTKDPTSFTALYYITLYTPTLGPKDGSPVPADVLDQGDKAAQGMLANLDKQKPATMSDSQWDTTKKPIAAVAHTTLGWDAMQRKDWEKAENEYKQSLALNPANGDVAYWLGISEEREKKPEKIPEALFYFARASAYDGPGASGAAIRQNAGQYLDKAYTSYHGSSEGLDQLKTMAKSNPTPPAGYKIVSIVDQQAAKAEADNQLLKEHPEMALYKNLKDTLTGSDGASYFNDKMKGSLVPGIKGKVISMEPATNPKTVVIGVLDPNTPDATLKFETALPGKVDAGTELTFDGTAESYTTSPFMIVFGVDKANLKGWTGKAAPVHRRAPVKH
jgi:tetratricopeptide (TPR) repeat protein